ncbi:hypothetical protein [Streptomyces natalensis]|uniref:Uncharacterized protein n=1 Tax=Streptomyces natalensis ATCC 27448 TaxID=1240678 RepID=A0A0D7CJ45_9ACTN|nr:hypothetical protein [Streptomyces natalensis]KIZ15880.1 hypothetical protein SNA_21660 [Streptomyces natalensis ATCC 27448]
MSADTNFQAPAALLAVVASLDARGAEGTPAQYQDGLIWPLLKAHPPSTAPNRRHQLIGDQDR